MLNNEGKKEVNVTGTQPLPDAFWQRNYYYINPETDKRDGYLCFYKAKYILSHTSKTMLIGKDGFVNKNTDEIVVVQLEKDQKEIRSTYVVQLLDSELSKKNGIEIDWALLKIIKGNPGKSVSFVESSKEATPVALYSYNPSTNQTTYLSGISFGGAHNVDTYAGTSSALIWSLKKQSPIGLHCSGSEATKTNFYTPWEFMSTRVHNSIKQDESKNVLSPSLH